MVVENDILIPEWQSWLKEGKEVRFTPSGVSMRPFIEGGKDSVVLAPVTAPKIGDIILAEVIAGGGRRTYVLHRLIRISNDIKQPQTTSNDVVFVLQGDGNLYGEEYCKREDLIGYVIAVETPTGKRKRLTRGRLWFYLFPVRKWLLKIYRHTILKWNYANN